MKTIFTFLAIIFISTATLNCMDPKITQEELANEKLKFLLKHNGIDLKTFAHASKFDPNILDNKYVKKIINATETGRYEDGSVLQKIYKSEKCQLLINYVSEKIIELNDAQVKSDIEINKVKPGITAFEFFWQLKRLCWIATTIQKIQKSENNVNEVILDIPALIAKLLHNTIFYENRLSKRHPHNGEKYRVINTRHPYGLEHFLNYIPMIKNIDKEKIDALFKPIIESREYKIYRDATIKFKLEVLHKLMSQKEK